MVEAGAQPSQTLFWLEGTTLPRGPSGPRLGLQRGIWFLHLRSLLEVPGAAIRSGEANN